MCFCAYLRAARRRGMPKNGIFCKLDRLSVKNFKKLLNLSVILM